MTINQILSQGIIIRIALKIVLNYMKEVNNFSLRIS